MAAKLPNGLSHEAAAARLAAEGPNELGTDQRRTLRTIAGEVAREPMFLLLLGAGAIYLAMGDAHEAMILLGFVVIIMAVTILQERRTENALEALRDLSSPRALVIRDGVPTRIAGRDVVRDDIVILRPRATAFRRMAWCWKPMSWPLMSRCSLANRRRWTSFPTRARYLPVR